MPIFTAMVLLTFVLAAMGATPAGPTTFPADAPLASREGIMSDEAEQTSPPTKRPTVVGGLTTFGEVTLLNVTVWTVDRYIMKRDWARISLDTVKQNLHEGFVWDTDEFGTNQFAHPYHGSLYYNLARDNGFGYLGSSLFTLLGSLQWELFAETERPAINDLANTTLGGIALGEVLYRLSSEVLDDTATGLPRLAHELFGAALTPSRGFNRLVHGRSWRVLEAPEEPPSRGLSLVGQFGYLKLANGTALLQGSDQLFAQLVLHYGDPVYDHLDRPYDALSAEAQFTSKEHRLVSHAQIRGVIASTPLLSTANSRLVLGALQHFDYTNVQAYEVGDQAFSGSLLYARRLSEEESLRGAIHLKGLVLGGISSEHAARVGRSYDYGPGAALELEARYLSEDWEIASTEVGMAWIHTLNGSQGQHLILSGRVQVDFPIYRSLGVGMSGMFFQRDSLYMDFPDTTQDISELRFFLSLH